MSDTEQASIGPKVILCPDKMCGTCKGNFVQNKCERIRSCDNDSIVIIEPKKSMIHLRQVHLPSNKSADASALFESVFIDEFNEIENWRELIGAYIVDSYLSLFFKAEGNDSVCHYAFPRVKTFLEYSLIDEMNNKFLNMFKIGELKRAGFQDRLDIISDWVSQGISNLLPEMNSATKSVIAKYIAHHNTPISGILPLILDEHVEEIYLDRPNEKLYFDHSDFGRVQTNFQMDDNDVSKLSTLLRLESNLHLDRKNPSLKTDIVLYDVPLRFSTSMPPLSPDGMNLEIRRARINPFTIFDLIQNGTLSHKAAALLILSINFRLNITITGEPGTGKTTLMNALDFTTPEIWRKIYIEDVLESRMVKGNHQVRFRVTPLDENTSLLDKSTEIMKCLHRSPDYLVLGEIQTAEHSQALFQSIVAGLRSIQTCHSSSPSSLVTRWVIEHNISTSSLALMDLIVSLKKPNPGSSTRFVDKIAEVRRIEKDGLVEFSGLNILYDYREPEILRQPTSNDILSSSSFSERIEDLVDYLMSLSKRDKDFRMKMAEHISLSHSLV